jgi:Bacterial Ig-like domain (group 2)
MNYLFNARQPGRSFFAWFVLLLPGFFSFALVQAAHAITVTPQSVQVPVGTSATVQVTDVGRRVSASSSNQTIATVIYASGTATVSGVSPGTATITIRSGEENRARVSVTVIPALTVTPTSVSVPVGGNAAVAVSNATGPVTVTSGSPGIATVSYASGTATIHGIAAGSATITIHDSFTTLTVSVTVTSVNGTLTVSPTSVSIPVGGDATVTVTGASGRVRASSSRTSVATVSYSSGIATIHGVSAGSTTVTIRDSERRLTVSVTVTAAAALTVSPTSVSVPAGSNATVTVSNATGTVVATSSNTSIATVSYSSGTATIHGVATGSTTVTIHDNLNTRTVSVTVTPVTSLTVSPTSVTVAAGSNTAVSVTNATGTVVASSSNTGIATVSYASGTATIHGVAAGSTTVTIHDNLNTRTVSVTVTSAVSGTYTLLAWNNLGMHCVDGVDYSIFAILPPLNILDAQLVNKSTGALVTSGVTLTYVATVDLAGSKNSISSTKTNFWTYADKLFPLVVPAPTPDVGLLGFPMASDTPSNMAFDTTNNWFYAEGIPITPYDDTMRFNTYPMVQVIAKNTSGQVLATTSVVLPVSDELTCVACHKSGGSPAAMPAAGWVNDANPVTDWKKNIVRLHDEKQANNANFTAALAAKGYSGGLFNSAVNGKPVLCVACHFSNAYQEVGYPTGVTGISAFTQAIHTLHATVTDPTTGQTLGDINNRNSCYMCHPGSVTQCLRGAMSASSFQCQSCHSTMSKVGSSSRQGWIQEPNCQACHSNGVRGTSAVDANGNLIVSTDTRFATTPNVPSSGYSLFRFSTGHGGLKCSACHGATHAEYPSTEPNDNAQSIAVQGYAGTVHECSACHASVPNTTNGGPHGMHTIGSAWVSRHHDVAEGASGRAPCAYCHGSDFRGTPLSEVKRTQTLNGRTFTAGQQVGCYDCHNGPSGD